MKKKNSGACWLAAVWSMRNDIMFCVLEDLVINIKIASWIWHSIGLKSHTSVTFYN